MQKLRRWAAAALCGAAFAGSAAAVLAACAVCPGRAWIVRGALFLQDPAASAAIAWPADAARAAYKPQKPDRRPTPVPTPVPYAITVDVRNQVTTVYGLDETGPDSCGDAHAGAVPRFHAAAQRRAGAGRRGPHPQRDAQAGQR